MKNKGLTLVELLAVIVLLSILAILAIPKIVEQKKNKERQIYESEKQVLFTDAATYIRENNSEDITPGQVFCITVDTLIDEGYISMDAEDFKDDTIKVTVDDNNNFVYAIDNNCSYGGSIVINKYKETILNGADPILNNDMIPVTIDNDGKVKKADITTEWYKYADKQWANAVVLTDKIIYKNNQTIPEDMIKAYYVWIPRYKYQLFESTTPMEIQVTFENKNTTKSTSTTTGEYLTHPAFTYGTDELNGFWVGKFEATGSTSVPTIKPNKASLRGKNVSKLYNASLLISNNSRIMKNNEWGAVAYLSHSKYGTNKQVRTNNNNGHITGCGAGEDDKTSSSSCEITYGQATLYPQSTTENVSGIFDMSGGSWEYVMSVRADSDGNPLSGQKASYNSGFNGKYGSPGSGEATELTNGVSFPEAKKYNLYDNPANRDSITGNNGCGGAKCYGHALTETKNWYGDYYSFLSLSNPWVFRGGYYNTGTNAGVFNMNGSNGHSDNHRSFRTVATQ